MGRKSVRELVDYQLDDLVFVKVKGYSHWPAKIEGICDNSSVKRYKVFFYGTKQTFEAKADAIMPFNDETKEKYGSKCKTKAFIQAMWQIENDPELKLEDAHDDQGDGNEEDGNDEIEESRKSSIDEEADESDTPVKSKSSSKKSKKSASSKSKKSKKKSVDEHEPASDSEGAEMQSKSEKRSKKKKKKDSEKRSRRSEAAASDHGNASAGDDEDAAETDSTRKESGTTKHKHKSAKTTEESKKKLKRKASTLSSDENEENLKPKVVEASPSSKKQKHDKEEKTGAPDQPSSSKKLKKSSKTSPTEASNDVKSSSLKRKSEETRNESVSAGEDGSNEAERDDKPKKKTVETFPIKRKRIVVDVSDSDSNENKAVTTTSSTKKKDTKSMQARKEDTEKATSSQKKSSSSKSRKIGRDETEPAPAARKEEKSNLLAMNMNRINTEAMGKEEMREMKKGILSKMTASEKKEEKKSLFEYKSNQKKLEIIKNIRLQMTLLRMDVEIKNSLRANFSTDVEKCCKIIEDLKKLPFTRENLFEVPFIVETIRRCRKFKGSENVCKLASECFARISELIPVAQGESFMAVFEKMVEKYDAENVEKIKRDRYLVKKLIKEINSITPSSSVDRESHKQTHSKSQPQASSATRESTKKPAVKKSNPNDITSAKPVEKRAAEVEEKKLNAEETTTSAVTETKGAETTLNDQMDQENDEIASSTECIKPSSVLPGNNTSSPSSSLPPTEQTATPQAPLMAATESESNDQAKPNEEHDLEIKRSEASSSTSQNGNDLTINTFSSVMFVMETNGGVINSEMASISIDPAATADTFWPLSYPPIPPFTVESQHAPAAEDTKMEGGELSEVSSLSPPIEDPEIVVPLSSSDACQTPNNDAQMS